MSLNKLLQNGIKLQIFDIKQIREIDKSPVKNALTEVIDFDKTKDCMVKNFNCGDFTIQTLNLVML